MRQYFCYVNPYYNGSWHPIEYHIQKNIGTLYNTMEKNFCVAQGSGLNDDRKLGYIEFPGSANDLIDSEVKAGKKTKVSDMIAMVLQHFVHVLEPIDLAKEKVERWTDRTDISIEDDKVIIPIIEPII